MRRAALNRLAGSRSYVETIESSRFVQRHWPVLTQDEAQALREAVAANGQVGNCAVGRPTVWELINSAPQPVVDDEPF